MLTFFIKFSLIAMTATLLIFAAARVVTWLYARNRITSAADAQPARVAIIFGAGLRRDGTPTDVLRDRVATGVQLYQAGKVEKLLMSGDNRFENYNEPAAMRDYAIALGVPVEDIVLDYAGQRTYDTCYRAKAIFQVESALLVTQEFHLPRAIFTCNLLGLPANGVAADLRDYHPRAEQFWQFREIPATLVAILEVLIIRPEPILGEAEPIFPPRQ